MRSSRPVTLRRAALVIALGMANAFASAQQCHAQTPGGTSSGGMNYGELTAQQWSPIGSDNASSTTFRAAILPPPGSNDKTGSQVRVAVTSLDGTVIDGHPSRSSGTDLEFDAVAPGTYSLVATGPGLVAIYAVHLVGGPSSSPAEPLLVSPAHLSLETVQKAVSRYLPLDVSFPTTFATADGKQVLNESKLPGASLIRVSGSQLQGQLYRAGYKGNGFTKAGQNNVLVYSGLDQIAQVVSRADGTFTLDDLLPGPYSIIIAGPDGLAVTGFEVVGDHTTTAQVNAADQHFVTQVESVVHTRFAIQLAPVGLESPALDIVFDPSRSGMLGGAGLTSPISGVPANQLSAMGGGAGGAGPIGGGGGGGSLGAGAGIGPVIGLGAVGAAIAVAASDDDDNLEPPAIASPTTP
ncbi:hypothetical protein [Rhodopirellula sp. MGV]|uniref:hypothetical protein n=1 Tax=Rhodopirellula sp. MGV TaxID=2023130 RepID=UPI00117B4D16|nr:hypothetical protein [Rhodopirellula sp. MGV]